MDDQTVLLCSYKRPIKYNFLQYKTILL